MFCSATKVVQAEGQAGQGGALEEGGEGARRDRDQDGVVGEAQGGLHAQLVNEELQGHVHVAQESQALAGRPTQGAQAHQ